MISSREQYFIDAQLEPDTVISTGKFKREPNGIALLKQSEADIKSDPYWMQKEREFQQMKTRQWEKKD